MNPLFYHTKKTIIILSSAAILLQKLSANGLKKYLYELCNAVNELVCDITALC